MCHCAEIIWFSLRQEEGTSKAGLQTLLAAPLGHKGQCCTYYLRTLRGKRVGGKQPAVLFPGDGIAVGNPTLTH